MDRIPDLDLPIPGPAQRSDVDKVLAALKALGDRLEAMEAKLDAMERKVDAMSRAPSCPGRRRIR